MFDTIKEYLKSFFRSRLLPITVVYIIIVAILTNPYVELQI